MTRRDPRSGSRILAFASLALLAVLPACKHRSADVTGSVPTDVRERHPIVLSEAPRSIEIYANGPRLDQRQSDDLAAFAADYRTHGRSGLIAEVPSHDGRSYRGHGGLAGIRSALAANGVSSALVEVRSYPAPDYTVAAPIRLSYARLQARVPHECGHWPEDFGASNARFSATNRPYWNFGCAYQTNLAAHMADPLDLERGRVEGRIDTTRRMAAIQKLREGQDPSTSYRDAATRINSNVGN
jgi:pilus assembly protein CpaD